MLKKKEVNFTDSNLWEYLKDKLYVKGIRDNNLTARHIYQYVTRHFKPKK
jgi:hypothetical protein